jgi:hypothetical protein
MTIGNHTIASLHEAYSKESKCELTQEQFVTLLTFYPALLVVCSDGEIDHEEEIYVKHIAKFMANSYADTHNGQQIGLEKQFYKNLSFLQNRSADWELPFLQTLKAYLQEIPLLKANIVEVMFMFADSSEGISEAELLFIKDVAKQLDIDETLLEAEY